MNDINNTELITKDFIDEVCEIFNKEIKSYIKIDAIAVKDLFEKVCKEIFAKYNIIPQVYLKYLYNITFAFSITGSTLNLSNTGKIYHLEIGLKNICNDRYYNYQMLLHFIYDDDILKWYASSESYDLTFKKFIYNSFLNLYLSKYIDNYRTTKYQIKFIAQNKIYNGNGCYVYYKMYRKDLLHILKILMYLSKMDNMKFSSTKMFDLINYVNRLINDGRMINISLSDLV